MVKKKSKKQKFSFLTKVLLLINCFFIFMLLLSYLNPYINPSHFSYLAIIALVYPVLVAINLFFILFWLIRGSLIFIFPAIAILIGINHVFTHLQFNYRSGDNAQPQTSLNILTYNVHLFGFYDWKNNIKTRDKMISFLETTHADVYCFQEFFDNEKDFKILDTLKTLLNTPYVYTDYFLTLNNINHFGLAVFSRLPILDAGRIPLKPEHSNYSVYTDVVWQGDTIRIFNSHLESIRFNQADYAFYEDLTRNLPDQNEVKKGSINIFRKLTRAYAKRAKQAELLQRSIQECNHPVIICGDFNDTPLSYVYHQLSKGLKDAFVQSGLGFGKTYSGIFPSYRIDYILYSPSFHSRQYRTYRKNYSDHFPVSASLVFNKQYSGK